MANVDALIARMDRWLSLRRPDYYALLQPGASNAQLDAFEATFSLRLPNEFRQLYRWRNGQDPMSFAPLYLNWTYSTLEDVTKTKDFLDGMIGSDFDEPTYWRRGWVPFLHNGGGSHLCIDLVAEDGGTPGQLMSVRSSAYFRAESRACRTPCNPCCELRGGNGTCPEQDHQGRETLPAHRPSRPKSTRPGQRISTRCSRGRGSGTTDTPRPCRRNASST